MLPLSFLMTFSPLTLVKKLNSECLVLNIFNPEFLLTILEADYRISSEQNWLLDVQEVLSILILKLNI